jgi:hypothetical protein
MKRLVAVLGLCVLAGACGSTRPAQNAVRLPDAPHGGEPAGTTGLHEADLRAQFGQPAMIRHDAGAEVVRIDGATCKAFFFLYSKDGNTAVWHVETSPRGQAIAADENCLASLRARMAPPPKPVS